MKQERTHLKRDTGPEYEYDAFVSYRTSMIPDGPVGEELQKVLESYPVPASLKQHLVEPRTFRNRLKVFRDTTDLNAGSSLDLSLIHI